VVKDIGFLYAGYGVVWVVLGVYLFTMGRRQAGLRRDIERLEREIGRES
jgi:CcmD family protein